jgi:hypothetical protein
MSESLSIDRLTETGGAASGKGAANDEPLWALFIGALLGALAFYLSSLWAGAYVGIALALVATVATATRRELPEAATFVAAAAFSVAAIWTTKTAILFAAMCFAAGLALAVWRARRAPVPSREA